MTEWERHEHYMKMAINFARRGTGNVSPNPKLGCVLVDDRVEGGRMVSWGYHRRFGGPHAEVEALKKAGKDARGCTAYVNLEPCCHVGKTPPCTDALIEAGVSSVVIGMKDPNPLVNGGGEKALRDAGIRVVTGVLEEECRWLNRGFIRNMTIGRPWVTVKASVSKEGKMILKSDGNGFGCSAFSCDGARLMGSESDALMVGLDTVLQDDPRLAERSVEGRSFLKVIVDRDLKTPEDSRVLDLGKCVFFTGPSPNEDKIRTLTLRGARVIRQKRPVSDLIPMEELLGELAEMGVNHLMVEGGSRILSSFIHSRAIDEYSLFVAPKVLGEGLCFSERIEFSHMGEAIPMKRVRLCRLGDDIWFDGVPVEALDL